MSTRHIVSFVLILTLFSLFLYPPVASSNPLSSRSKRSYIHAKKAKFPFYVYGDESGKLSTFSPSGYMGDASALSSITSNYDESAPASTGRTGKTSLVIRYSPKGKEGWAGLYWLTPANNWGRIKGAGYDLSRAERLTFWMRGEKGGERLAQVKVGGVNGPFPDSDSATLGPLVLSQEWQQYTVDLEGKDLRHIVGGFMFLIRRSDNVRGATFYIDEIVFKGTNQGRPTVKSEEDLQEVEETETAQEPNRGVNPEVNAATESLKSPTEREMVPLEKPKEKIPAIPSKKKRATAGLVLPMQASDKNSPSGPSLDASVVNMPDMGEFKNLVLKAMGMYRRAEPSFSLQLIRKLQQPWSLVRSPKTPIKIKEFVALILEGVSRTKSPLQYVFKVAGDCLPILSGLYMGFIYGK